MIENGITDNGIYYVKDNDTYYCIYYLGENVELSKEFNGVTQEFIDNLSFDDLAKK